MQLTVSDKGGEHFFLNIFCISFNLGACYWWRSWLRHCGTSRKVAGSIADGVIRNFHLHNPPGRNTILGLTQPLTERWPVCRAENLSTFMCRMSCKLGASAYWNSQGLSRPVACCTSFIQLELPYIKCSYII